MMLFPKALVFARAFPKIDQNSIFLLNFHHKLQNFLKISPTNCVFRPNARRFNTGFIFWKQAKIMQFLRIFKIFPNSENSPASQKILRCRPYEAITSNPPKMFLITPLLQDKNQKCDNIYIQIKKTSSFPCVLSKISKV